MLIYISRPFVSIYSPFIFFLLFLAISSCAYRSKKQSSRNARISERNIVRNYLSGQGNNLQGLFNFEPVAFTPLYDKDSDIFFVFWLNHYYPLYPVEEIKGCMTKGRVKDFKGDIVNGGGFYYDSWKISPDLTNKFFSYKAYPDGFEHKFGSIIEVTLEGNEAEKIPSFTHEFTLPEEITFTMPVKEAKYPNLNNDTEIAWNKDADNPMEAVILQVIWDGAIKVDKENKQTGNRVENIGIEQDDGSVLLTSDYFNGIPEGGYIRVILNRVNYETFKIDDRVVKLIGLSDVIEAYCYVGNE